MQKTCIHTVYNKLEFFYQGSTRSRSFYKQIIFLIIFFKTSRLTLSCLQNLGKLQLFCLFMRETTGLPCVNKYTMDPLATSVFARRVSGFIVPISIFIRERFLIMSLTDDKKYKNKN